MLTHQHTVQCRTSRELRRQLALLEGLHMERFGADLALTSPLDIRIWRDDETREIQLEVKEAAS